MAADQATAACRISYFSHCCGRVPDRCNLRELALSVTHGSCWWGRLSDLLGSVSLWRWQHAACKWQVIYGEGNERLYLAKSLRRALAGNLTNRQHQKRTTGRELCGSHQPGPAGLGVSES